MLLLLPLEPFVVAELNAITGSAAPAASATVVIATAAAVKLAMGIFIRTKVCEIISATPLQQDLYGLAKCGCRDCNGDSIQTGRIVYFCYPAPDLP